MKPVINHLGHPLDSHELAWAAGIMDGEGVIGCYSSHARITLKVTMTDEQSIRRFARAVGGVGKVDGPIAHKNPNPKWNPYYRYAANSFEAVQFVVAVLWRWLGGKKKTQATHALLRARTIGSGRLVLRLMRPEEKAKHLRAQAHRHYKKQLLVGSR